MHYVKSFFDTAGTVPVKTSGYRAILGVCLIYARGSTKHLAIELKNVLQLSMCYFSSLFHHVNTRTFKRRRLQPIFNRSQVRMCM